MNRALRLRLLLLLLLLLPPAAVGCAPAGSESRPAKDPIAVKLAPVAVEPMALPVTATGTLRPKEDVDLSFKVGGVISRILVDEGVLVRRGQVLAALELGEIEPAVARARIAAEKAERDRRRVERLYADSVATLEQLQDAQSADEAAQAEYQAAVFDRTYAVITAPAAGVVLHRSAEPGEIVGAGMPILTLGNRSKGQALRAGLTDHDVLRVALGDRAAVRLDALPDRTFEGTVTEIAAAADPATGTYGVEISLPGADALASGLVGTAEIHTQASTTVTLVPVEAVLEADGNTATVYTLDAAGKVAARRHIEIAFLAGERIAVRAGLEGVTAVVTQGAGRLDDGDWVEVVR